MSTNHGLQQAHAQIESIVSMVAALNCDYERLQELREKQRNGHYVAGWNMPGYMPDSAPCAFDTDTEARAYIADAMGEGDIIEKPVIDGCRNGAGEYGATLGAYHYWVTFLPNELADESEKEELADLETQAGECGSEEEARERIEQDALSVEVRSGWTNVSTLSEVSAEEFRIVLCTGGPHVELLGELENGTPHNIVMRYRDWGESGELEFDTQQREAIETYCAVFYFGE